VKKINRAVCGTVAILGVCIALAGLILCMCEAPELEDQIRNMATGSVIMLFGSAMAYIGGAGRWTEGPYAGL